MRHMMRCVPSALRSAVRAFTSPALITVVLALAVPRPVQAADLIDATTAAPGVRSDAELATFVEAFRGTWVLDPPTREPERRNDLDVIDGEFATLPLSLTNLRSTRAPSRLRAWQPADLQRIPISATTADRLAEAADALREHRRRPDQPPAGWKRPPLSAAARMLTGEDDRPWLREMLTAGARGRGP